MPDAVLEGREAVLGSAAVEPAAGVVDVPHVVVCDEDAPELALDVPVEHGEQGLVGLETEGDGAVVDYGSSILLLSPRLHDHVDLDAAPGALGGDLHVVEQEAQIFCLVVRRACAHECVGGVFYTGSRGACSRCCLLKVSHPLVVSACLVASGLTLPFRPLLLLQESPGLFDLLPHFLSVCVLLLLPAQCFCMVSLLCRCRGRHQSFQFFEQ